MCQIPNSSLMTPFSACGSGGCRGVISVGSARKGRRSKEKEWRTRWKRGHEAPLAEASHSQEREPMSATHRTRSSRRPTERDGKAFWDAAQFDHHLTSSSGAYIASQPLCPREPSMGTFCPGKGGRRRESEVGPVPRCIGDARVVCTPVGRIDGSSLSRAEGLNQRQVGGGARSPGAALLSRCHSIDTVRAFGPGAATANAGRIHHAQAAVSFSTPPLGRKRVPCWTLERLIGLERKVWPREATRFPGSGSSGWTVPRYGHG